MYGTDSFDEGNMKENPTNVDNCVDPEMLKKNILKREFAQL